MGITSTKQPWALLSLLVSLIVGTSAGGAASTIDEDRSGAEIHCTHFAIHYSVDCRTPERPTDWQRVEFWLDEVAPWCKGVDPMVYGCFIQSASR